ncbi:MAG: hypothetical protein DRP59_02140 [Spirochaetes bacterium]|nr:MAG: hypothetical protein DRP59_02140 [Spirochaetota bacterium]
MVNPILLIIVPLGTAFLISLTASFLKNSTKYLALLAMIANVWVSIKLLPAVMQHPINVVIAGVKPPLGINLFVGPLGAVFSILISAAGLLILLYSFKYIEGDSQHKYYTLFLLLITGSHGMILTGDVFNLFVFFEILAISSYILVGYEGKRNGLEAAVKYLILGSIGSILILVAVALIYQEAGTLNMADLADKFGMIDPSKRLMILVFFITGMGVEAAVFPLNSWLPDAHSSAPSSISAMLSGFVIEVALIIIVKFVYSIFAMTEILGFLSLVAVITLLVGEFAAYKQSNIKRVLAYSSIGQIGLILFAMSLNSTDGLNAGLMQIINHTASKSILFLVAGFLIVRTGSYQISDYRGIAKKMPVSAFFFVVGVLSLLGVPPFFGFFSKLSVVMAALHTGSVFNTVMVFLVLLGTIIESIYFLRIIQIMYNREGDVGSVKEAPFLPLLAIAAFTVVILAGFLVLPQITGYTGSVASEIVRKMQMAQVF